MTDSAPEPTGHKAAGSESKSSSSHKHHRRHRSHSRMAPCPACGRMIGSRWARCPFCGELAPFNVGGKTGLVILAAVGVPLLLFLIGYVIAVLFTW